jgi:hypothetical protein
MYDAFSNLNSRFQNLLNSPTLSLKIKFSYQSKWSPEYQCTHIVNLISLIIWYLSPWKTRSISNRDGYRVHSKINDNKIFKIHLEKLIVVEQIESLIDLCPLMEYLEIIIRYHTYRSPIVTTINCKET